MSEGNMDDMIRMLADAPEAQRKSMLSERVKMIASQPEPQRVEAVKDILLGVSKLDPAKRKEFVKTRTNLIAEAPPEMRKSIQSARVKAGALVPEEVNQADMMAILEVCQEWPAQKHQMFLQNLGSTFKELGMQMPDVNGMMRKMQEAREEMKKPWWKFW
jgi:hypothetical protein